MINYELAKKLKDAGFPQEGVGGEIRHYYNEGGVALFYCPTLSELIEACGDDFEMLQAKETAEDEQTWTARAWNDKFGHGNTPEEAVANLWLKLNE